MTVDNEDQANENSCVLVHYQMGKQYDENNTLHVLNELSAKYLDEATFNYMRTKE